LLSPHPVSSSELARQLGVHKSTLSHLTATLIEQGFLEKEPGSARLLPGNAVYRIARAMFMAADAIETARPFIEKLADDTGETSHLCELRGRRVLFILNSDSKMSLRVQTESGMSEAAHSTAIGKALLSGLPEEEAVEFLKSTELEKYTDSTLTGISDVLEELKNVRARGYAVDNEEQTPGMGCIAAPVRDKSGKVVAAVGISGPVARVFVDDANMSAKVKECAAEIEKKLKQKFAGVAKNGGR